MTKHLSSILALLLLAAAVMTGQQALAENVTYTFSGYTETDYPHLGDITCNLIVTASGSVTGTVTDVWDYATTQSRTLTLPGNITINFGSDKTSSLAVQDRLNIEANGTTGGYITLTHGSMYIYHVTLTDKNGVTYEVWNMTNSYTYRFQQMGVVTIEVEYADQIPFGDAVLSGIEANYPVSDTAVAPIPTVTWHGNTLTRNTHYTLAWANNTSPGTATVTANATGIFTGSASSQYTLHWATYTVRFVSGYNGISGEMDDQTFTYNTAQNLTPNTLIRTGYTFTYWLDEGGYHQYSNGQSVINLTAIDGGIVELYPQWTPNTYTVRFNKNADDATGTMSNQTFTYDNAKSLRDNAFSRPGHYFDGWNTKADGSGTAYRNKQKVENLTDQNGAIVDLYAQWLAIPWNGSGTATDPFVITDTVGLNGLSQLVNSGHLFANQYFVLANDIAYHPQTAWNANSTENNFSAIGHDPKNGNRHFDGTFDGQGHTISGIRIYDDASDNMANEYGLFGRVDGTVKNLTLADASIRGRDYIGGIAGRLYGTVENCHVTSTVVIHSSTSGASNHGGIAGGSNSTIRGCTSAATLADGGSDFGGIVGDVGSDAIVANCLAHGATVINGINSGAIIGQSSNDLYEPTANYYHNCSVGGVTTNIGMGHPAGDQTGACQAYTVSAGQGVTLTVNGTPTTTYDYNGIEVYAGFLRYGNVIYAPAGAEISLTLSGSPSGFYETDHGTLSGSGSSFTLTMEANNTVISAIPCAAPTGFAVSNIGTTTATLAWTGYSGSYIVTMGEEHRTLEADFETNDFSQAPFTTTSTYPWIVSANGHNGNYCAKSGNAGHNNTNSDMVLDVYLPWDMNVSFWAKIATDAQHGRFYIDGVQQLDLTGAGDWTAYSYPLAAGIHTLRWNYEKGSGTVSNDDCLYLDDIVISTGVGSLSEHTTTDETLAFSTLTPDTWYYAKVKGDCGENGQSDETDWVSFHTLVSCTAPTGLHITTAPTTHGAGVAWDAVAGATFQYALITLAPENLQNLTFGNETQGSSLNWNNLTPNCDYGFFLRKKCDEGDFSTIAMMAFHTIANCSTPTGFAVTATDIHSATLTWTGSSAEYEVSYRTAAYDVGTSEGFETGNPPDGWERKGGKLSSILSGGNFSPAVYWTIGTMSGVFDRHAYFNIKDDNRNNWLITPQVAVGEGGGLHFDLALTGYSTSSLIAPDTNGNDDRFVVLITTDNKETWTILREWNNSGSEYVYNNIANTATGERVSLDLSAYEGQTVRIAFYGESTVQNANNNLHIDNVLVGATVPAGPWQTASTTETTATLNNLLAGTAYEAYLRGNCGSEGYSDPTQTVSFSTLAGQQFTTTITGWGNSTASDHWAFIASPVAEALAPSVVTNLVASTASEYDLYRLNPGTTMWENIKATSTQNHPDFTTLVNGRGYLYANKNNVTLTFAGTPITATEQAVGLSEGWNLVGNPFHAPATLNKSYYKMNPEGTGLVAEAVSGYTAIDACTGVIVKAEGEDETVLFTKSNAKGQQETGFGTLQIALTQAGNRSNALMDNAIVSFNEGDQLGKFYFGTQDANIYIPQGNKEYAIVSVGNTGEMPINFKAHENGEYTITVNPKNVEMGYLHLIDNLTGANVDLLQTPEYVFTAQTADYESRFKLVFSASGDANGDNEAFAFIDASGNIIITDGPSTGSGTCTLQVIDVMGRVIFSRDATRHVSTSGMAPGVYVLRLINGDDVRTQKIIID